jgi:hypothetical protein
VGVQEPGQKPPCSWAIGTLFAMLTRMLLHAPVFAQKLRRCTKITKIMRRPFASLGRHLLLSAMVLCACSAAPQSDVGGAAGGPAPGATICRPPAGVSGSPRTIEDAVTLLNALPKPTSIGCFLESLDRPLYASATYNVISAQPAFSVASPRIFLRLEQLVLSVVPEGEGSQLLEFSYLLEGDARSVKAELGLPLTDVVSSAAPYQHVLPKDPAGILRGGTVCGGCHAQEQRVQEIDFAAAYSSVALRPNPAYRVSLEALSQAQKSCDARAQPERCAMLTALFGHGAVLQAEFPSTMVIFN